MSEKRFKVYKDNRRIDINDNDKGIGNIYHVCALLNRISEENDYYKAKCGSLEEGYLKLQRENDKLKKENEQLKEYNNKLMKQPLLFDIQTIPNTMEILEANTKLEEENEQLKKELEKFKKWEKHIPDVQREDLDRVFKMSIYEIAEAFKYYEERIKK